MLGRVYAVGAAGIGAAGVWTGVSQILELRARGSTWVAVEGEVVRSAISYEAKWGIRHLLPGAFLDITYRYDCGNGRSVEASKRIRLTRTVWGSVKDREGVMERENVKDVWGVCQCGKRVKVLADVDNPHPSRSFPAVLTRAKKQTAPVETLAQSGVHPPSTPLPPAEAEVTAEHCTNAPSDRALQCDQAMMDDKEVLRARLMVLGGVIVMATTAARHALVRKARQLTLRKR
eukprot:GHVU01129888.1.p1 GENE.GHVU01129888.1~~GHVU01129888.1.p1  ORF type:complete len:232 (-),score=28.09 GHVU01129888.1:215-910(-)